MDHRELLEEIYALWGRGEYSDTHFLHPDFELTFAPGFLDTGSFHGIDDAWRGWRGWLAQWSTWRYEPVRYIPLDDGRMAVFIEMHGVSKSTGVELESMAANLWEFEGDLARRLKLYAHREDLVRELGLEST